MKNNKIVGKLFLTILSLAVNFTCREWGLVDFVNGEGKNSIPAEVAARYLSPMATGQAQCWDSAGILIGCTGTGQDGEYQLGRSANFIGPTLTGSDYITTDNATGLVWKTCSEGITSTTTACDSGTAPAIAPDWPTANATTCSALNTANAGAGYANKTNWRLPSVEDLETLINYNAFSPASFATYFPATVVANVYWTSSTAAQNNANAWVIDFNMAGGSTGALSTTLNLSAYVRCVSGTSSIISASFIDHGDGTVTDKSTNLVWQKCSMSQNNDATCSGTATLQTWASALTYCNTLTLTGRIWRLPNINELKSITDKSIIPNLAATNNTVFPSTVVNIYWSSSTYVFNTTFAWVTNFGDGSVYNGLKTNTAWLRCVSTGP